MECIVLQENLHQALTIVLRAIGAKSDLPVLSNVYLETKDGKLTLAATNLEMGIRTIIGGKVEKEGAITVPAKIFYDFVSTLPAGRVTLSVDETLLRVKGEMSQAQFATIPATEFPPFSEKTETGFVFSKTDLQDIARHVAFAASADEGRPVLTGIQMKRVEDQLTVAATDGFRLSVQRLLGKVGEIPTTTLPAKVVQEIAKIATDKGVETVELRPSKQGNQIVAILPETEIYSRLLDGDFPPYERIIPSASKTKLVVERLALLQAVKAAAIFARESANIVRFQIGHDFVELSANTPQLGEEKSRIEAKVEGEENEIAFNFRFLLDFLNNFSEEEVVLEMTDHLSPGLFHGVSNTAYSHIIMPVRVQA